MYGLAVYVKNVLPFVFDFLFLVLGGFLLMFLTGFTSLSALLLFPLLITFLIFMHGFFIVSSKVDEVLLINLSANVFVFGNFNIQHKDWITYSGGILSDLTSIFNAPIWIPDSDSHTPALLDLFISSDASVFSAMAFSPLGNSYHVIL